MICLGVKVLRRIEEGKSFLRMDNLNYVFRQGTEHECAYDFETLAWTLTQAGFAGVSRRSFNARMHSEVRSTETLYADAHKPSLRQDH